MEIVVLVCVVGALSFWVWSLKQEIAELRRCVRAEPDEIAPRAREASRVRQGQGGEDVQTWTL
jgi:hypothetical protein